jgi:hypothetical protein
MKVTNQAYFPLIVILGGIIFSLYLELSLPERVFFSGDAGLKALLAQQLSQGTWRFDLIPPALSWVQQLWREGLYPFSEPFVYFLANKHYITFPFTFPLVTAPFYALFGYRGLYLVPLLATWAIWTIFYYLGRELKFQAIDIGLGLICLIFASNLTLYSAMYWEHTLAVALAFAGTAILLTKPLKISSFIASGFLIGLSIWFRPEFFVFAALTSGIVLVLSLEKVRDIWQIYWSHTLRNSFVFIGSLSITVGLFFLCNQLIYTHFLGIHAIQIVEQTTLAQRLKDAVTNFQQMTQAFLDFFPITYVGLVLLFLTPILNWLFSRSVKIKIFLQQLSIYLFALIFTIGVSLLVPIGTAGLIAGGKQWGPRFLLILIPLVCLTVVFQLNELNDSKNKIVKYTMASALALVLIIGINKNILGGKIYLDKVNESILPAIEILQKEQPSVIAISDQFVAQAIQASLEQGKIFLKVDTPDKLLKLSQALIAEKQSNFIYICYPHRACELPKQQQWQFKQQGKNLIVKFVNLGEFGKYPIYKIFIS